MNREGIKAVRRREDGEKESVAAGGLLVVMGGLGWWICVSLARRLCRFSRMGG